MSGGWDIRVLNQPAQWPDMNVLDLGFFNTIQAPQQRMECSSIEDLVCVVEQSFEDLAPSTLDKTYGTLLRVFQACLGWEEEDRLDELCNLVNGLSAS
ncbi:hypothetical protein H310_13927 [Aphanomyces invadans]|uniref:Uncharacterized protein n=1 Tax=Aphanomyces invadans TaxID=157072 RepID=A0A024TC19_9STRA|nr:hypothetical protein H310_13927 [Aphanomyces invadans]ETV91544.1 hypothetical protein H310_13927 [Aphanomyces invadans]|eukprot:XP_008879812.1 hypothetical protein H310_13927 [Aphanomyces invadans]